MELVRADADFRPHAELTAVRETCRSVPVDGSRIDIVEEIAGVFLILRDDRIAVPRTLPVDVIDCRFKGRNDLRGNDQIEVFS